jgi:homoserine kinase type II
VDLIHRSLNQAIANGCDFVPKLRAFDGPVTVYEDASGFWEAANWLPGEPTPLLSAEANPQPEKLHCALAAIGQLHRALRDLETRVGPAPAVDDRLRRLAAWDPQQGARWQQRVKLSRSDRWKAASGGRGHDWIERWAALADRAGAWWEIHGARLVTQLNTMRSPRSLQVCLRDVRRTHVLFIDERVTGIIDFGALRVDWPALDLARYLAECSGPKPDGWLRPIAAHARSAGIGPIDADDIRALAEATQVVAVDTWVQWLFVEPRFALDTSAVVERLQTLEHWFMAL